MTTHTYLDHGVTILNARLQNPLAKPLPDSTATGHPFVTISREACAGATALGKQLVPLLNQQCNLDGRSWIFLDKDLITHALTKHHLPERLVEYLPEDRVSEIKSLIGELVGLHLSVWELEHKVTEAILQLAHLGCVILTERASNLITRSVPGGIHVRLVASLEARVKRMMELKHCDAETAKNVLLSTDHARERYVQSNYQQDIEDPHGYDLVINTDHITPASAARLIVGALHDRTQVEDQSPLPKKTAEPTLEKTRATPFDHAIFQE